MNKFIKSMLLAMAGIITPILYSKINALAPGFPLAQAEFAKLITWMITGLLGSSAASVLSQHLARLDTRNMPRNSDFHVSHFWTLGAYGVVAIIVALLFF